MRERRPVPSPAYSCVHHSCGKITAVPVIKNRTWAISYLCILSRPHFLLWNHGFTSRFFWTEVHKLSQCDNSEYLQHVYLRCWTMNLQLHRKVRNRWNCPVTSFKLQAWAGYMIEFIIRSIGSARAGHLNRIRLRPYILRLLYGHLPYRTRTVYMAASVSDGTARVVLRPYNRHSIRTYGRQFKE